MKRLAEEWQRDDKRKERDSRKTAATTAPPELRDTPDEPDPNPNRELQMQPVSSKTASRADFIYRRGSRNTNRSADGD